MAEYLEKFNTDNVFLRIVSMGLLRLLNDKVTYLQTNSEQEIVEIYLPFFFSLAGDESFLQDEYLHYVDCDGEEKQYAEGNYDIVPRGVVIFNRPSINTAALTNKYVRASYVKEDPKSGEMKTFSAHTNQIPLNLSYTVKVRVDTTLDSFKIIQSIWDAFYKVASFDFSFDGNRVEAQVGFPEDMESDKQFEFSYGNSPHWIEISFDLLLETYYPQKDKSTERFRGNLMQAGIKVQFDADSEVSGENDLINIK